MKIQWTAAVLASLVVSAWAEMPKQGVTLKAPKATNAELAKLGKNAILLGGKGLTVEKAAQASQGVGKVLRKLSNGLIVVQPSIDRTKAMNTLRQRGIAHVVESEAAFIDKTSLVSVQRHRKYLQAFGADYFDALEYYLSNRVGPDGKLDKGAVQRSVVQRELLPAAPWGNGGTNNPLSTFTHVGPTNVGIPYSTYYGTPPLSGRKNDLAISPSNPSIMYVASAGGGIWKTVDAGSNWTPVSDKWAFLHVSAIAVHPTNPNIVIAGTGDYNGFFGAQTQGMMRSMDGGLTWTQVGPGTIKNEIVTKIMFEPTNPAIVIAISGKGPTGTGGIYRSTDAGTTFSLMAPGYSFEDLDRGPTGAYWVVGTDGLGGVIGVSTNQGLGWNVTTNPVVNVQQSLDIAASKVNANTAYLLATGDEEIYKTVDGGANWVSVKGNFPNGFAGNTNYNWSQKTYDQWIGTSVIGGVDLVLVGLIGINQSLGGNGVWSDISQTYAQSPPNYVHSDQHMFAVNPSNPAIMYFGCDGGLFRYTYSANPVAANFTSLNATIKDLQLYQMSLHPSNLNYLMAGCQDNSSPASRGNLSAWSNLYAGDGGWSGFDRNNPGIHYTTSQNGSVWRYTSAADPSPDFIKPTQFNGQFIAPFVVGGNGSQIYMGDTRVLRWTGAGQVWNDISGSVVSGSGKVNTMSLSPSNPKFLYTGSNNGDAFMSLNIDAAVPTFKRVDNGAFGTRPIGAVAASWGNFYDCLVGLQGTGANRLYRCTNTNAVSPVWTNVTGNAPYNLPDSPINAIIRDPYQANTWYVGTDIGLFMTTNAGASWYNMNTLGLPNVHVNALHIDSTKTWMYVGTFGRGIWRIPLTSNASFSITGTVRKVDNSLYSGVTMILQKFREQATNFARTPNLAIPDNDPNGVTDSINVPINQQIKKVALTLNITHPFRGDLRAILIGPDGHQKEIFGTSSDSGDNIVGTFDVGDAFNGLSTLGTWTLKVSDEGASDIGTLNSWKLTFFYDIYGTVQTKTTDANGNYSFTGLDAGQYKWYPYVVGKTWTPGWRTSNIGTSKTGQDFKANN